MTQDHIVTILAALATAVKNAENQALEAEKLHMPGTVKYWRRILAKQSEAKQAILRHAYPPK